MKRGKSVVDEEPSRRDKREGVGSNEGKEGGWTLKAGEGRSAASGQKNG